MRDEKEERKKQLQARSNKQTRQSNTAHPKQSLFLEKMSYLRWDSNPRHSEGRKKEASKVKQTNKAKQHSTPKAVTFPRKNELQKTLILIKPVCQFFKPGLFMVIFCIHMSYKPHIQQLFPIYSCLH